VNAWLFSLASNRSFLRCSRPLCTCLLALGLLLPPLLVARFLYQFFGALRRQPARKQCHLNWLLVFQRTFVRFLLTPLGGENRRRRASFLLPYRYNCGCLSFAFLLWPIFHQDGFLHHAARAGFGNRTVSIISRTVRVQL